MDDTREVISAFLDGETFDPDALMAALSDPTGRELLVDLAALRRIVQPSETGAGVVNAVAGPGLSQSRRLLRWSGAAAALVVALIAGYAMGTSRQAAATGLQAPPATRIVQALPLDEGLTGGVR